MVALSDASWLKYSCFGMEMTLVESAPRLLPREEPAASKVITQVFKRGHIELRLGARITRLVRPTPTPVRPDLDNGTHVAA